MTALSPAVGLVQALKTKIILEVSGVEPLLHPLMKRAQSAPGPADRIAREIKWRNRTGN